jgi:D-serine ammonia-lyase
VSFENSNLNRALPLRVGQKVHIWPNHTYTAAARYDSYFIVDSSLEDLYFIVESNLEDPNRVIDIWVRWRG